MYSSADTSGTLVIAAIFAWFLSQLSVLALLNSNGISLRIFQLGGKRTLVSELAS
jgi:hypothetical protein